MNFSERRYDVKKEPELRFPGFEGEWERKKLGELCQIEKGKQINKNTLSTNDKYYVLNGGINPSGYTDKFNTEANTVSINEGGSCGFVKLNTTRFWSGGHNYTLLNPKCEVKYLYNYLKWREKYLNSLAVGTGIPNIQKKVLQDVVSVSYPLIQEQTKIGSFLSTIDTLISTTEKELEEYRELKRGMLQKMFPKNGADVPEIRFPGFTDAWEQRKLGTTNTFFTDGNYGEAYPKSSDMTDSSRGIPFLTGGNLNDGKLSLDGASYITPEKHSKLTSGHLLEDDIVIAVRGSLGALGYVNTDNSGWNINSQLAILRTDKSELYGKFLIQYLLSWTGQNELLKRQTGSALKQLSIGAIKDVEVPITSVAEQEKIGEYFADLDNLITLHQRELEGK